MNGPGNRHPRERLSEYLDDRLGVEDRASMDRHLAECEDCRVELDALRRLARAIAGEEVPPVPVDLQARIGRKLDAATGVRPHRRRFVVPATIAATIATIGILVTLQLREGRLVLPAAPEPKEQSTVLDELRRSNTPLPQSTVSPDQGVAPLEQKKEDTRSDALEKDLDEAPAPTLAPRLKQKADERAPYGPSDETGAGTADDAARERAASKVAAAAPTGVAGGVAGGVVGGVEGGVPGGLSPCVDRWSDSGVRGTWEVQDVDGAARDLSLLSREVGGIGLWRGNDDGRPFVVVVPRNRFDEVFYTLRARGVGGLDALPALDPGTDCKGISVALIAVAPR